MARINCMTDLWIFSQLAPADKKLVHELARRRTIAKGEILFSEGDPASTIFLITEGRIKLFKVYEDGKEVILGFLTVHDLFGEETLFTKGIRSMSAQAVETSRICACEQRDFEKLVGSNPDVAVKVIQTLGAKLSQVSEQLADAAVRDVRERVINSLVRLAREYGQETRQGLRLGFRLTHEDLGALVGASRVMVTNVLHDLRKAGEILTDDDRRFIVSLRLLSTTKQGIEVGQRMETPRCPCFSDLERL